MVQERGFFGFNYIIYIIPVFHVSEIHYVPTPFSGPEHLLYIIVMVRGEPVKVLIDGAASRSFLGPLRMELIDKTSHLIDVGNHPTIKQRHYLVSPNVMKAIVTELDGMLEDDVIEPSHSEW